MQPELSMVIVFVAGLLSFLSPYVLPLIPGYIAFVAGLPLDEITENGWKSRQMATAMLSSIWFVTVFSIVFVSSGASATWLGGLLVQRFQLLVNLAGVIIIIFGLQQIGLFTFSFFMSSKQINLSCRQKNSGRLKHRFLGRPLPSAGPRVSVRSSSLF